VLEQSSCEGEVFVFLLRKTDRGPAR
jgi:hypothetical protein